MRATCTRPDTVILQWLALLAERTFSEADLSGGGAFGELLISYETNPNLAN